MSFRPYPRPANEDGRLAAIQASGLLFQDNFGSLDHVTALAARLTDLSRVGITLIDKYTQYWVSSVGVPWREIAREDTLCNDTIALGAPIVVEDLADGLRLLAFSPPQVMTAPRKFSGIGACAPAGMSARSWAFSSRGVCCR